MAENPFARIFTKPAGSIALAVLEPDAQDAPIKLSLINAIASETSYECISYDRSQQEESTEVSVDGRPTQIPQALHGALRALRSQHRPRNLWADVLIGDNVQERSTQAMAMKTIVGNAEKVIAWLGPGDENTLAAFDVIQTMANRWQQARLHSGLPANLAHSTGQQILDARTKLLSYPVEELRPSNSALWETIQAVFTSSYFATLQSIPEVVLAKNVVVASGGASVPWPGFKDAGHAVVIVLAACLNTPPSESMLKAAQRMWTLEVDERRYRAGESLELVAMIGSARDTLCSDPREYVFSMLPMVTPSVRTTVVGVPQQPLPSVDYSKSINEVFREAGRYIVSERQDFLLWWNESPPCRRNIRPGDQARLPSWVPDWTAPLPIGTVTVKTVLPNGFRAWWEYLTPKAKRISVDEDFALLVQGHPLDRIASVSPIFTESNCRRLCLQEWKSLLANPDVKYQEIQQRMWRTLVLNSDGIGATVRETAAPRDEMVNSFMSMLTEEEILVTLDCTFEQLTTQPELLARARADSRCSALGPTTGYSQPFVELLKKNTLGRRFYRTENGFVGMTAIEAVPPDAETDGPPRADFSEVMADDLGRMMLGAFQTHLARNNPQLASVVSQGINGRHSSQRPAGARVGDLVVALVGGFQPYILRAMAEHEATSTAPDSLPPVAHSLDAASRYVYVGDTYVHGIMNGEPFKTRNWLGMEKWQSDVKLVDIKIV